MFPRPQRRIKAMPSPPRAARRSFLPSFLSHRSLLLAESVLVLGLLEMAGRSWVLSTPNLHPALRVLIGMCIVIPMALLKHGMPPLPATEGIFFVMLLGLVPTAGANLLRNLVIRSAGPVFMSLTNYRVPLWAVLLGVVFLGEPVQPSLLWAALLILSGLGLSQFGALKRLFSA